MVDSEAVCPTCGADSTRKDGRDRCGVQVYRCHGCRRRFTALSATPFSGYRFPPDIIALAVRWYLRYRLSYADVAELLAERGIRVDPSSVYAWVQEFAPLYEAAARSCRRTVGDRWSVDETYVKVAADWVYVYRALDEQGQIVDSYVSAQRAAEDAATFFRRHSLPCSRQPCMSPAKRPSSGSSAIASTSKGACAGCAASRPCSGQGCSAGRTRSSATSVAASTFSAGCSGRRPDRPCRPRCLAGRR